MVKLSRLWQLRPSSQEAFDALENNALSWSTVSKSIAWKRGGPDRQKRVVELFDKEKDPSP